MGIKQFARTMKARRPITRRSKESDSSPNLNRNGPNNNNNNNNNNNDGRPEEHGRSKKRPVTPFHMSIPGALQCIHHEWAKYEVERSKWAVDKAELEAKVAFLKGQRKGQERLVHDLVCRVKMLEYSLKEERAKYHRLKYGTELQHGDVKPPPPPSPEATERDNDTAAPPPLPPEDPSDCEEFLPAQDWRQGRQLLRQYLKEIGYTEAVVNVNSYRVNSLLRLYDNPQNRGTAMTLSGTNQDAPKTTTSQDQKSGRALQIVGTPTTPVETEAEIMAKFDFLPNDGDADDEGDDHEERTSPSSSSSSSSYPNYDHLADNELTKTTTTTTSSDDAGQWVESWPGERTEETLGDLAYLNATAVAERIDYMTWTIKYMLRGHYDAVRSVAFHPVEPVIATASEDSAVILWDLGVTRSCDDLEPAYTFRGHGGPVMCVAVSPNGRCVFSGGLDGSLLCWEMPENVGQLRRDEDDVNKGETIVRLEGHSDIVWGLSHQLYAGRTTLLSCSSDGTVRLWAPDEKPAQLSSFRSRDGERPTSVDFSRAEPGRMATAYDTGECVLYDLEYGRPVVWLETATTARINRVVSHPVMPVTVTAGEDGRVRFYDDATGRMVHCTAGHRDSVSSVAIDRYGMYMLTGSHDRTVCVWDVRSRNRIQQIHAHGNKYEESVLDVAFHQTRPLIASAGADGFAQVFRPT